MRFNRKAAQRAIDLAVAFRDARYIPLGLAFEYRDQRDRRRHGCRGLQNMDDRHSVAFYPQGVYCWTFPHTSFNGTYELCPALKPRSPKKHELRKRDRDMRRMKQYD